MEFLIERWELLSALASPAPLYKMLLYIVLLLTIRFVLSKYIIVLFGLPSNWTLLLMMTFVITGAESRQYTAAPLECAEFRILFEILDSCSLNVELYE